MYGICDECEANRPREEHAPSCRYHPANFSEGEPEPEAEPLDYDGDDYDPREWREYAEEQQSIYDDMYPSLEDSFPGYGQY